MSQKQTSIAKLEEKKYGQISVAEIIHSIYT